MKRGASNDKPATIRELFAWPRSYQLPMISIDQHAGRGGEFVPAFSQRRADGEYDTAGQAGDVDRSRIASRRFKRHDLAAPRTMDLAWQIEAPILFRSE